MGVPRIGSRHSGKNCGGALLPTSEEGLVLREIRPLVQDKIFPPRVPYLLHPLSYHCRIKQAPASHVSHLLQISHFIPSAYPITSIPNPSYILTQLTPRLCTPPQPTAVPPQMSAKPFFTALCSPRIPNCIPAPSTASSRYNVIVVTQPQGTGIGTGMGRG